MSQDVRLACHAFPAAGLACPVTAVTGREDAFVAAASTAGWGDVSTGPFHAVTLPTGHFPYRSHPESFSALLLGELDHLDGAYGRFP